MTKISPIVSEFETAEEAEAYDAWFRAKVEKSLADTRPSIPHDQVMAEVRALIASKAKRLVRLEWQADARRDLLEISDFISDRNERAALDLVARIEACAERLPEFPYLHRIGRVPGTREAVVHPNYILVYQVAGDVIRILHVFHARQQCP